MSDQLFFSRTQRATGTPFEPTRTPDYNGGTSPFVSIEAQSAIEESYYRSKAFTLAYARFSISASENGNISAVKYLSYAATNPSNTSPFIWPRSGKLTELSVSTDGNATATFTVDKNGVSVASVSLAGASSGFVSGLSVSFSAGDKMSCEISSGASKSPLLVQFGVFE